MDPKHTGVAQAKLTSLSAERESRIDWEQVARLAVVLGIASPEDHM